jgi:hypothetical protein
LNYRTHSANDSTTELNSVRSLRYHIAIDCLVRGTGGAAPAQAVLEMLLSAGFFAGMGHGTLSRELLLKAECCIARIARRGFEKAEWFLAPDELSAICEIVGGTTSNFTLHRSKRSWTSWKKYANSL